MTKTTALLLGLLLLSACAGKDEGRKTNCWNTGYDLTQANAPAIATTPGER